ncbi:hypothetical protein HZH68_006998 [Vespula germanica]|uniref:Uncharacterized protein n=1 Tax=Vespula germanica TaxID=30212 RepID=A0A834NBC4_VESGE|nr:hypothetical protein HZH68_006998 [Vespula germanica]
MPSSLSRSRAMPRTPFTQAYVDLMWPTGRIDKSKGKLGKGSSFTRFRLFVTLACEPQETSLKRFRCTTNASRRGLCRLISIQPMAFEATATATTATAVVQATNSQAGAHAHA